MCDANRSCTAQRKLFNAPLQIWNLNRTSSTRNWRLSASRAYNSSVPHHLRTSLFRSGACMKAVTNQMQHLVRVLYLPACWLFRGQCIQCESRSGLRWLIKHVHAPYTCATTTMSQLHQWSSGRIHRCHRCDPGSIPG